MCLELPINQSVRVHCQGTFQPQLLSGSDSHAACKVDQAAMCDNLGCTASVLCTLWPGVPKKAHSNALAHARCCTGCGLMPSPRMALCQWCLTSSRTTAGPLNALQLARVSWIGRCNKSCGVPGERKSILGTCQLGTREHLLVSRRMLAAAVMSACCR